MQYFNQDKLTPEQQEHLHEALRPLNTHYKVFWTSCCPPVAGRVQTCVMSPSHPGAKSVFLPLVLIKHLNIKAAADTYMSALEKNHLINAAMT